MISVYADLEALIILNFEVPLLFQLTILFARYAQIGKRQPGSQLESNVESHQSNKEKHEL